jgi:hypothetical protein
MPSMIVRKEIMKIFLVLFTAIPLLFISFGINGVWSQHTKITSFVPVRATVVSTAIRPHSTRDGHGRTSTTYSPEVTYNYTVADRTVTTGNVLPLEMSASKSWAEEIVGRYQPGEHAEAYFNPAEPAEAFLVKQYSFMPYFLVLFPLIFLAVAAGVGVGQRRRTVLPTVKQPDGWFEIRPLSKVAASARQWLMISAVWLGACALICGHYFLVTTRPYEVFAIVVSFIFGAMGCVPLGLAIYLIILRQRVADARVFVDIPDFFLGGSVTVLVRQPVLADLEVKEMRVNLVCRETYETRSGNRKSFGTRDWFCDSGVVMQSRIVTSGATLSEKRQLNIPTNQPPSTRPDAKGYPRFDWLIEVKADIPHSSDYHGKYPIVVAGDSAPANPQGI